MQSFIVEMTQVLLVVIAAELAARSCCLRKRCVGASGNASIPRELTPVRSRNRMAQDIEQKLLKFLKFSADPVVGFPPSVGIEVRVAGGRGVNHDSRLMTLQGTMQHPSETSRVIRAAYHDDERNLRWLDQSARTGPSSSVPATDPGIWSIASTPSDLSCRMDRAASSS